MKGDYLRPGVMPGQLLEQIDLPSAYLVCVVGRRLRGATTYAGGALFRIPDPIGRSLGRFSENYGHYWKLDDLGWSNRMEGKNADSKACWAPRRPLLQLRPQPWMPQRHRGISC